MAIRLNVNLEVEDPAIVEHLLLGLLDTLRNDEGDGNIVDMQMVMERDGREIGGASLQAQLSELLDWRQRGKIEL